METQQCKGVSMAVYKATEGHGIDEITKTVSTVMEQMKRVPAARARPLSAVALREVHDSWVALVCLWPTEQPELGFTPPELRGAQWRWMRLTCQQQTQDADADDADADEDEGPLIGLRQGDVVSVRRIYGRRRDAEQLQYASVAVLRAYYASAPGLRWTGFFAADADADADGTGCRGSCSRIVGLALWDSVEDAAAAAAAAKATPADAFWRAAGAKLLKHHVARVVMHF